MPTHTPVSVPVNRDLSETDDLRNALSFPGWIARVVYDGARDLRYPSTRVDCMFNVLVGQRKHPLSDASDPGILVPQGQ